MDGCMTKSSMHRERDVLASLFYKHSLLRGHIAIFEAHPKSVGPATTDKVLVEMVAEDSIKVER